MCVCTAFECISCEICVIAQLTVGNMERERKKIEKKNKNVSRGDSTSDMKSYGHIIYNVAAHRIDKIFTV